VTLTDEVNDQALGVVKVTLQLVGGLIPKAADEELADTTIPIEPRLVEFRVAGHSDEDEPQLRDDALEELVEHG
jgi:hypothetical protein